MNLKVGSSNVIEWLKLTNMAVKPPAIEEGASMEVTLQTLAGVVLTPDVWPLAMPHISGGDYQAILDPAIVIVPKDEYRAIVDVTGPGGGKAHREFILPARIDSG